MRSHTRISSENAHRENPDTTENTWCKSHLLQCTRFAHHRENRFARICGDKRTIIHADSLVNSKQLPSTSSDFGAKCQAAHLCSDEDGVGPPGVLVKKSQLRESWVRTHTHIHRIMNTAFGMAEALKELSERMRTLRKGSEERCLARKVPRRRDE